ncbi:hypothetical protein H632_c428p0 [Helicosporidium sp. ATCC 50920]|nr:hypothetical protein H632_c428p0 [Helicosporidium sp. ATCC 50920]|eukprot:KDD75935.1 hypothetical protein H632_c428p0 [Helicosporidium sp. ATCC 50920]
MPSSVDDLSSPIQEPTGIDSLPRDSQLEVGTHLPEDASSQEPAQAPLTLSELAAQAEREAMDENNALENDGERKSQDPSRKLLTFSADKPGWNQVSEPTADDSMVAVGVEVGVDPPRAAPGSEECTDIQPGDDSCAQQKDWGKCGQPWIVVGGYCMETCGACASAPPPPPPAQDPAKMPPQQEAQAMCEQAPDPGTGSQSLIRWYYDPESQKCRQFNWTGQGGNSNCFVDFATCSSQAALHCGAPESAPFL